MAPADKATLDALNRGIQAELAAYVFYKKCLEIASQKNLKELFEKLALDEKDHYRILEGQYDSLVRSEIWVSYNFIMQREGLPDIDEKMEEVHSEYIDKISDRSTPGEILQIALQLEQRAKDLYDNLAKSTSDPKGKETYQFLAQFESGHIRKIQQMMKEIL